MDIREILAELKRTIRTGWAIEGIEHPESVADHTWGMTLLLLMAFDRLEVHGEEALDRERALKMAIVHDLQEAITGDLVVGRSPEGMTREEKGRLEGEAERQILAAGGIGRLNELWDEYRLGKSLEARLVKDMDRLEMALQALAYRDRGELSGEAVEPFLGTDEGYGTETGRSLYRELVVGRGRVASSGVVDDSAAG